MITVDRVVHGIDGRAALRSHPSSRFREEFAHRIRCGLGMPILRHLTTATVRTALFSLLAFEEAHVVRGGALGFPMQHIRR